MMRWLRRNWHTLAGTLYLMICAFDFIIMPIIYEMVHHPMPPAMAVEIASKLKDGAAQVEMLQIMEQQREWQPITLGASGILHLSFGAILGVGVWAQSRGFTRANQIASLVSGRLPTPTSSVPFTPRGGDPVATSVPNGTAPFSPPPPPPPSDFPA